MAETKSGNVGVLSRCQFYGLGEHAIPALNLQFRRLNVRLSGCYDDPSDGEQLRDHIAANLSQFSGNLVTAERHLPLTLLHASELLLFFLDVGTHSLLHHLQHLQWTVHYLLKQMLLEAFEVSQVHHQ